MEQFEIERKALIKELIEMGIKDKAVLEAINKVPRHFFVPGDLLKEAYANYPLPIPGMQTISQPYTVAFMLEALELKRGQKVLEIGTGSGWNAALIAHLVGIRGKVITTEIVPELINFSKQNIKKFGLKNIKIIETDGSQGYAKEAPYDRIIVTAACLEIPIPLVEQLKERGIIVAPVGPSYNQEMIKARKVKGRLKRKSLGFFAFVPLTGKYGY
ncbi:MAG: protein-L-isoaspartate(D-aspartate) O-methyltransferase [Candidatus Nanoarchaeia archaeon]